MADIETLIQNIATDNMSNAGKAFDDLMKEKLSDALDQEKAAIANAVFNGEEPEEPEEPEELEIENQEDDIQDEDI